MRFFCGVIEIDKAAKPSYDDFNTKECERITVRAPFVIFKRINCV